MQKYIINVTSPGVADTVYAKQGDTERVIQLTLTRGGAPYIPPSGTTFVVFYATAAGEGNYSDGLTLTDNLLTVPLIEQMLDAPGGGAMCVVMFDADGGQLGTWNLQVDVERVPGLGSEGATQWFTALSDYVGQTLANAQEAQAQADRAKGYADSIDPAKLAKQADLTEEITRAKAAEQALDTAKLNATAQAADSAKLGGKTPGTYTPARNLLLNSNFADPVNMRGQDTYSGIGFCVDKWQTWADGTVYTNSAEARPYIYATTTLHQYLRIDLNKTYTLAVSTVDGAVRLLTGIPSVGVNETFAALNVYNGMVEVILAANTGFYWAALYEGEYTADTLPIYIVPDKRLEMLRCGVDMHPVNLLDNSDFTNPVNQRGQADYSTAWAYSIDRWLLGDSYTAITCQDDGVKVYGTASETSMYIYQRLPKLKAGSYTLAAKFHGNNGRVSLTSIHTDNGTHTAPGSTASEGVVVFRINAPEDIGSDLAYFRLHASVSAVFEWAALYEGSYTAETLPPYRPKGYAVELAECYRYYFKLTKAVALGMLTNGETSYYMHLTLPTAMRSIPKIIGSPSWRARTAAGGYSAHTSNAWTAFTSASVASSAAADTTISVVDTIASSAGDTNNAIYAYEIKNLELSADL